ncbi:MAG: amidohydrolase [Deltaproteobacteria bacterium]|nr:amidohydrolase [Deltaproteobacteria bacterium]
MTNTRKYDLVIEGGALLTMAEGQEPLHDVRVMISGDTIADITTRHRGRMPETKEMINAEGTIILPGLINSHVHSPMTIFRGMADDLPLKQWLFDHIFPAEARYIHPDVVYWASLLACAEMIASGTTTIVDGYFLADEIVKAVSQVGMRALVAQGVIDFPAPGVPEPAKNIDVALGFMERWKGFFDLITPGLFCHSPLTCSEETLRRSWDIARGFGTPLQIHLSETEEEVVEIEERTGFRPAFYLDDLGILGSGLVCAHAIHLSEEEIGLLKKRGVAVAHCPESNMKLGAGIAAVGTMLEKGITVGLGTDGCASNNNLDLLAEMDTAAKLGKYAKLNPTALDAQTVLGMATRGGARLMGIEDRVGTIEAGKKADIIIVDANTPHMVPLYHPFSQIVYSATGGDVRDVIINGTILYRDRRFTALDVDEVQGEVRTISRNIQRS